MLARQAGSFPCRVGLWHAGHDLGRQERIRRFKALRAVEVTVGVLQSRLRDLAGRILLSRFDPFGLTLAKFAKADSFVVEMPTRNISLTPEQDAFVEKVVESGEYQNASEMVRDALRVLQQRRREDTLKLEALRAQLEIGVAALDRGDFVELEDAELERHLAPAQMRPRKLSR